ncbi:MAG: prepilin-type N-terminal cleavage/methylation domain-containing protein [Acidimicrobiales bacterium]
MLLHRTREVRGVDQAGGLGRDDREAGFTLIELMVVMLIMAILLAIAIPTFLGTRNTANNRAAQSSLENALTTAKAYYARFQNFSPSSQGNATLTTLAAVLSVSEPQLHFAATGGTSNPNTIVVNESSYTSNYSAGVSNAALFVGYSRSGECWFILDVEVPPSTGNVQGMTSAGTFYGSSKPAPATGCSTVQAPKVARAAAVPGGWSGSFK